MAGIVAKNYCDALFALAQEEQKLDVYKEQLDLVADSVKADHNFRAVMVHPKINKEEKKTMLSTIYANSVDHMILNFLKLLVDKGRFSKIEEIRHEFTKAYNDYFNIQVVYVKSATELKADEVAKLKTKLEAKLNKKVDFKLSVDESLIAGVRIKINDQLIDNTARTRLERLKHNVLNAAETK